ncbi:hypothetical protein F5Y09DRAFT_346859 [Xylaria sp. FL1042]|nr:hypothetical protein F5Y09DRAFT_346859 [Xylaria sp. FL1042]
MPNSNGSSKGSRASKNNHHSDKSHHSKSHTSKSNHGSQKSGESGGAEADHAAEESHAAERPESDHESSSRTHSPSQGHGSGGSHRSGGTHRSSRGHGSSRNHGPGSHGGRRNRSGRPPSVAVLVPDAWMSGGDGLELSLIGRMMVRSIVPMPTRSRRVEISNYDEHPRLFDAIGAVSRLDICQRQQNYYDDDSGDEYGYGREGGGGSGQH